MKTKEENQEDVLFNCYAILKLNDFEIDDISEDELISIFGLNHSCKYGIDNSNIDKFGHYMGVTKCKADNYNGVCCYNHYIPLRFLVDNFISFLKSAFEDSPLKKEIKDNILNNFGIFKGNPLVLDISECWIKSL